MKNGRCRLHGGLSTGPKTPEGLARSRKARWKHGEYSAEAKRKQRAVRARLRWADRFIRLMGRVDHFFRLLDEIAYQIDSREPKGLRAKCVRALGMWRDYQSILAEEPRLCDESQRRQYTDDVLDQVVKLILDAGAAGSAPNEILNLIRSYEGGRLSRRNAGRAPR